MIDALIAGKLHGKAVQRTGKNDNRFVTAKLRASIANGESIFVNVITFIDDVGAALLALDDGDSVSLSGALVPKVWTDGNREARPSLDLTAHAAITSYHVTRKRRVVSGGTEAQQSDGFDDESF